MLRRPEIEEIVELGSALGLNLTLTEARIMHSCFVEYLAALEAFENLRIAEQRLPLRRTMRDSGYCPTDQEDPLHAFIRKCRVEGTADGPLSGKEVGFKDHISVAGIPLTFGCRLMEGYIPEFDATIVTRILDAGGTLIGKMNMGGFSFSGAGLSGVSDYGRPINPHHPAHVTGESSSGSAAAVAGGYVDIAFGGDQGGSIRVPASWCGVVGLKATYGLIPHTGVFGSDPTIDHVGPLTQTVEEVASVLDSVAGPDGYDPRQVDLPATLPRFVEVLTEGVEGLRIGVLSEGINFEGNESDVNQAVLAATATLERLGARIEEVSVPLHEKGLLALLPLVSEGTKRIFDTNLGGAFMRTYYPTSLMMAFGRFKRSHGHEFVPDLKVALLIGAYLERLYQGRLYAKAQNVRPTFIKQYDEVFTRVDILAMPTTPIKAPTYQEPRDYIDAVERTLHLYGDKSGMNIGHIYRNTAPFNLTGHPALSVPCAKSNGLPIGLQLVAPFFREDLLLRAAYAFEHSIDWVSLFPNEVRTELQSKLQNFQRALK